MTRCPVGHLVPFNVECDVCLKKYKPESNVPLSRAYFDDLVARNYELQTLLNEANEIIHTLCTKT